MAVKLTTNHGDIVIELDAEKAPETVKNFLAYVEAGHYDNTIFHRVINGFMIQGGGMDRNMKQKPTNAPIKNPIARSSLVMDVPLCLPARGDSRIICGMKGNDLMVFLICAQRIICAPSTSTFWSCSKPCWRN